MIRVEIVLPEHSEHDLIEEGLVGMAITTAGVGAARAAEPCMRVSILLAMQSHAESNQPPGIALRIFRAIAHVGKVAGDDLADVRGDRARRSTSFAEAVKPQVLLRLAE
jgi:hypothetical protein